MRDSKHDNALSESLVRRTKSAVLVVAGLLFLAVGSAAAADGALDPTFGAAGKVITDFGARSDGNDVVLQPDGRIVVVGTVGATDGFALARYFPDGSLDSGFGAGGKVTTTFRIADFLGATISDGGRAEAAVLQPDGKLVVVGGSFESGLGGKEAWALARYNSDGSLDGTFGTGGRVITFNVFDSGPTPLGVLEPFASAVALQPDGKLVVGGHMNRPDSNFNGFVVVRYNPNGSLDLSFGIVGFAEVAGSLDDSRVLAVAVQGDGKVLAAGNAFHSTDASRFALVRYNPDGRLDATFGNGGIVTTDMSFLAPDELTHAILQPDGKLVVAGTARGRVGDRVGNCDFALARYNTDGSLDSTFGSGGRVTTDFTGTCDKIFGIARQCDGKIVAVGDTVVAGVFHFALARYNPDGSLDATFGQGGTLTTDFAPGDNVAHAVAIQLDGKPVAAGYATISGLAKFAVSRYEVSFSTECCGDGLVEVGEQCDDGNRQGGDCCSPVCTVDPRDTVCDADQNLCTIDRCDGSGRCLMTGETVACPPASTCEPSSGQCRGRCRCQGPLFIGEADQDRILRECRNADGSYTEQVVVDGVNPGPMTFGPDGNLYVMTGGASDVFDTVVRINPDSGAPLGTFVPAGSGGLTVYPQSSIRFGPDGDLYIGSADAVKRYRGSTGAFLGNFVDDVFSPKWGGDGFLYGIGRDGGLLRIDPTRGVPVNCYLPGAPFGGLNALALEPLLNSFLFVSDYRAIVHFVLQTGDAEVCPILSGTIDGFQTCGGRVCEDILPGIGFCSNYMGPLDMVWAQSHPGVSPKQYLYAINRQAVDCGDLDALFDGVTVVDVAADTAQRITPEGNSYSGIALQPPLNCDDHNACTADACDDTLGCQHTPLSGNPCSDNDECTTNDRCQNGTCIGGPPPDCNAGLPQCEYSPGCHPVDGCIIKYREGGGCDDGNLCTTNDFCCSRLDVGPPCNLERKCVGGPPVVCSALDQCHDVGTCNPATGVCSNPPKANGTPCTDSNVCTLNDTCQSGTCAPGAVKDCRETPTDNVCTIDSCDPVRDCQHSAPVTRCDAANSTGGFVGGPNNTQCANGTRDANNNCTVSTGVVDLTFPPEALTTPTNINIISTPATPGGACDFTLENFLSKVASCIELEPSGQKFNSPVTATFKWTNTTSQCLVGATAKDGSATALQEGTLTVHWKGQCNAGKCEDTTTPCTGTSCNIQLTPRCDAKQLPSTCQICCPACPGAGCTGSALNYSCLKPDPLSPCTGTPSCSPGANKWTVPLTHFSDYALGFNPPPPDHFQCYKSGLLSTTSLPAPLTLVDRFGTVSASIIKPLKLCSPTDKDGEDPDAVSHANYLQSYAIELLNRRALDARLPVRGQKIVDTFGTHTVDVRLPDRFLVPTTENVDSQPLAPDASVLDHFTCYKVKQTKGTPRFAKTTATVVDQFDQFPQTITLKKPAHLCVPSDKNGEQPGAEDNRWQLMCYRASRPFVQVRRRFTNNELGPSYVYPLFREELCVPALKG